MSNFHLQEIETLQNSLREREEYVTELEDRIKRLEELGNELRECASMIGTYHSNQIETIDQAEAAVEAWDKEAKL